MTTARSALPFYQPRDHRKQFDDQADAPRFQIVDRRRDTMIGIVTYARDVAPRQEFPRDEIRRVARLDSCGQTAQVSCRRHVRRYSPLYGDTLIECQVGP